MTKQAPNANCIDPRTHELVQRDAQRTHNIQTLPTHSHKNIVFMKDNEYTKAMQLELGAEERKSWMVWTLEFPHSRSSEGATMKDQRDAQAWPEADPTIPHHQQARDSLDLHIETEPPNDLPNEQEQRQHHQQKVTDQTPQCTFNPHPTPNRKSIPSQRGYTQCGTGEECTAPNPPGAGWGMPAYRTGRARAKVRLQEAMNGRKNERTNGRAKEEETNDGTPPNSTVQPHRRQDQPNEEAEGRHTTDLIVHAQAQAEAYPAIHTTSERDSTDRRVARDALVGCRTLIIAFVQAQGRAQGWRGAGGGRLDIDEYGDSQGERGARSAGDSCDHRGRQRSSSFVQAQGRARGWRGAGGGRLDLEEGGDSPSSGRSKGMCWSVCGVCRILGVIKRMLQGWLETASAGIARSVSANGLSSHRRRGNEDEHDGGGGEEQEMGARGRKGWKRRLIDRSID
ncbi:hypothetical protein DFP72DRAFT_843217 [Ephemerocybe angulata]|uniref:Uncharacterized protein n=1 Tax=Ephemerocybe angulata TaxID=980116 RepID=A0A8H6I8M7_9AGAR|nr:hypothetical protein DFP72DRAFT_843217 [Tulosesus angulatus]